MTVADVGYSRIVGHGRVYNLHRLSDFNGTYGAATGEATLVNGLGGQYLKNGQGVELRIDDVTRGARLSGSADGIQLEMRALSWGWPGCCDRSWPPVWSSPPSHRRRGRQTRWTWRWCW